MYKSTMTTLAFAAALAAPGMASAQEALPISANVTFATDYAFRGISQTNEEFAVQGGFDYANEPTGIYVGTWASNVNFGTDESVELDLYGGWKQSFGDFGVDVGFIHYDYPGSSVYNTDEVYVGGSWKWITAKYYYTISDEFFGVANEDGAQYFTVGASYTLPMGLTISGSYGVSQFNDSSADYNDYKVGVGYDYAGLTFGLAYVGNDSDANADIFDDRVIFSISKSM